MSRRISDLADRMVLLCDADGQIMQRSGGERSTWKSLLDGKTLFESLCDVARNDVIEKWDAAVRAGRSFQVPLRYPDPEIHTQMLLLSASRWNQDSDLPLWIVVAEAISNTILDSPHEIALGRAVLETAVDAIMTIDHTGDIHSVNPAACRMFGYAPDELLSRNVTVLMPEPYRSEHDQYLASYMVTQTPSIIGIGRRATGIRRNGEEFPIHLAVSEFQVGGKPYFTGMIRDLSELEHVQKQLLQSERLAAIGQMVTGLAHESRNALQRAQGCMDMLSLDLEDAPDQLDLSRRATAALQQLHRLYEEVRGYAAPIHLEFRECRLSTIWRKEWDHLSQSRGDKQVTLAEELQPAAGSSLTDSLSQSASDAADFCEVDVHRMEQVFRNILENAIHACSDPGRVTIRCTPSDVEGRPGVQISFMDDGAGLNSEAASQIFEPFFTTKQKGTGLGMAIVHRIISTHSGQISAHPNPGGGTEIRIILPRTATNRNKFRSE
jgi:two-component system, LuxR family, sensor kinase FixL